MGDFTRQQLWDRLVDCREKLEESRIERAKILRYQQGWEARIERVRKEVGKREEIIEQLKKKLSQKRNLTNIARYKSKVRLHKKNEMQKEYEDIKDQYKYISKDLAWDTNTSRQQHVEIIVRTIITYNKLISTNIINFNEFAFLLIGSQKQFFDRQDLKDRYGSMGYYIKEDIVSCVKAGYLQKVEKKNLWYITVYGKKRLNDILKFIYEEKIGMFKLGVRGKIKESPNESE